MLYSLEKKSELLPGETSNERAKPILVIIDNTQEVLFRYYMIPLLGDTANYPPLAHYR